MENESNNSWFKICFPYTAPNVNFYKGASSVALSGMVETRLNLASHEIHKTSCAIERKSLNYLPKLLPLYCCDGTVVKSRNTISFV